MALHRPVTPALDEKTRLVRNQPGSRLNERHCLKKNTIESDTGGHTLPLLASVHANMGTYAYNSVLTQRHILAHVCVRTHTSKSDLL